MTGSPKPQQFSITCKARVTPGMYNQLKAQRDKAQLDFNIAQAKADAANEKFLSLSRALATMEPIEKAAKT
jgi:hypothetical protein